MKVRHVIIDYPCSEYIIQLRREKIISMVHSGMDACVGRYGTNLKTLKKILKKHQGGSNER